MYEPLIAEIKNLADRIIVGKPFEEPAPFMGPVIDNAAADGLTESFLYMLTNGGKATGLRLAVGADSPNGTATIRIDAGNSKVYSSSEW